MAYYWRQTICYEPEHSVYEDGTRPLYVNSIAVDQKGNVYTQARINRNGKVQTELICIPNPE